MLRGRVAQLLEFCISNLIYQNMYNESFIKYLNIHKWITYVVVLV